MATVIWTLFAAAVMLAGFAACVIAVAACVSWVEHKLARRRSATP